MSNMPIYSQVLPKSQYRSKTSKGSASREFRAPNSERDIDPLNYNHGGNIQLLNAPMESRIEKMEKRESRRKDETRREREAKRVQNRTDSNEGKVKAYLRQNQVNMRQQQHRHSAVRQAEHRVNLRLGYKYIFFLFSGFMLYLVHSKIDRWKPGNLVLKHCVFPISAKLLRR